MKMKTLAVALTVTALTAVPALACSGAKKGSLEQSSISAPSSESPIFKPSTKTSGLRMPFTSSN
ncbi:hypothetical protein [Paracoccus aminophilus]|uniref:hypothetical protein n=1 Tax=Paracoccus aminophilus TaxID=34003 RepID=UPI0005A1F903|nr:hypothetical protein [Paracoccus aminophilus]